MARGGGGILVVGVGAVLDYDGEGVVQVGGDAAEEYGQGVGWDDEVAGGFAAGFGEMRQQVQLLAGGDQRVVGGTGQQVAAECGGDGECVLAHAVSPANQPGLRRGFGARCREVRSRTKPVGIFPLARCWISRSPDAELHCVGLMPMIQA